MNGADATLPRGTALRLIGRGVLIELMRRKDAYVLLFLMAIFLGAVAVCAIVGIDDPATGTFLLNLGLTVAALSAHALTLLLAARQMPSEIEAGTLYPLLARPLTRADVILGKWASCALSGTVVYAVLFVLAWGLTPKLESYAPATLLQMLLLQPLSLSLLAALALLLSLVAPRSLAVTLAGLLWLLGGPVAAALRQRADAGVVRWLAGYLPDFGKLNLTVRYTDGIAALGAAEFAGLLLYGGVMTAAALALGMRVFERRRL